MAAAWLVGLGYASPVAADCVTDEDCGDGFVCVTYESPMADCDTEMPVCDDEDEACLANIKDVECSPAEPVIVSYCERATCESDADCGDVMVCNEYVDEWCSYTDMDTDSVLCDDESGACSKPAPAEPVCGSETRSECGYKYEAACEVDADCGEGFTCEAKETCQCSAATDVDTSMDTDMDMDMDVAVDTDMVMAGDVGTAPDEAGAGFDISGEDTVDESTPIAPECTCEPTGEKQCELKEIECGADADCPAGMFCDDSVSSVMCTSTSDGEPECEQPEAVRYCYPEGYRSDDLIGISKNDGDNGETGEAQDIAGQDTEADTETPAEPDVEEQDTENGADDGQDTETVNDDDTDSAVIGVDDDDTTDTVDKGDGTVEANATDSGANDNGGCSVVAPAAGSSTAGLFLSLLGLAAFAWRRR